MASTKHTAEKKKQILKLLNEGYTGNSIARIIHVSEHMVTEVRREHDLDKDYKIKEVISEKRELNRKYDNALKEINNLKKELSLFTTAEEYIHYFSPLRINPHGGKKGQATAIINACDWHCEEEVNKEAVNGVNEYNKEIADRRIKQFWSSAASLVDMCRSRSIIDTIILNLLGDLITGWIHDPLMATNNATPPEATLRVIDYLISGIEFLLKEVKPKQLIIPCVCGNHSRITAKKFTKIPHKLTFEWLVYNIIARYFTAKKYKNVRVVLPQGDITYYDVYGFTVRITHGDNIRYQGGIGGVHVPLRKAIDGWNTQKRADINYIAHWHNDIKGEDYRVGGSLIGYNEYSIKLKCRYQDPSQPFELIHPRYGQTAQFPIKVR